MASERLQVILELVTGQYKREARQAADATGQISRSARTATGGMSSLTGSLTSFARVAGTAFAAAGIADFARDSIKAASDLEESINAVKVVYGEAGEGILALGENSVDAFGMSQQALNDFSVRFSAFADNIAGSSGRGVVEVVEEMTTRLADFASVHNVTMEEAATIAQSTLAGETEAFRRFGGDVSAAAVQLKGMEMGLGSTSAELTEQEKILIRYELFMEQTAKTAGDFANTSESTANTLRKLNARFTETKARVGQALMPAFMSLLEVAEELAPAFEDFAVEIGGLVSEIKPLLSLLGELVGIYSDVKGWTDDAAGSQNEFEQALGKVVDLLTTGGLGILGQVFDEFTPEAKEAGEKTREVARSAEDAARQAKFMADATKDDLVPALSDAVGPIDSVRSAQQRAADATKAHADQIVILSTRLAAQINPALGAIQAVQDLRDANDNAREAAEEFGEGSDEAAEANVRLALQAAITSGVLVNFGGDAEGAIRGIAEALDIGTEEARQMLEQLGLFPKDIGITVRLDWEVEALGRGAIPEGLGIGSSGISKTLSNAFQFQHGGVVPGRRGSEQLILAHGGETVLPTHKPGMQSLSRSLTFNFGGMVQEPKPLDLQYLSLLSNHQTFGKF